jgi:glutathione peroxidase
MPNNMTMKRTVLCSVLAGAAFAFVGSSVADTGDRMDQPKNTVAAVEEKPVSTYVLDYTMDSIDGKPIKLESFKGDVILMVNVASKCGLTPQYEGLEKLYKTHKEAGLKVIGFPANNFGSQEPGTDIEISQFCSKNYGVTFPMMSKISVKGKDVHPLYKQLAAQPEPVGGEPQWNFDKFLINRSGEVVARFGPRTTPEDPALIERIQELLEASS